MMTRTSLQCWLRMQTEEGSKTREEKGEPFGQPRFLTNPAESSHCPPLFGSAMANVLSSGDQRAIDLRKSVFEVCNSMLQRYTGKCHGHGSHSWFDYLCPSSAESSALPPQEEIIRLLTAVKTLKEHNWFKFKASTKDTVWPELQILFTEWYMRFVVMAYGSIGPGFREWPFKNVHESVTIIFDGMKVQMRNKCVHFAQEFANLLLDALRTQAIPGMKSEPRFNSHLEQSKTVQLPVIRLDLRTLNLNSIIIGAAKLLIYFRKECNVPSFDQKELYEVFDAAVSPNGRDDVKNMLIKLFLFCSNCWTWDFTQISSFVNTKFGHLLNLDEPTIVSNPPEFQVYIKAMRMILKATKAPAWAECFLLLLIRIAWKTQVKTRHQIGDYVLEIAEIMTGKENQGFRLFRQHCDYLMTQIIPDLILEEQSEDSTFPVGTMFFNAMSLFNLTEEEVVCEILPAAFMRVLVLGSSEAHNVFIDLKNEFEINFTLNTCYFPELMSTLINELEFPAIEAAMTFVAQIWRETDGWEVVFRSKSRVITEILLNYHGHEDTVMSLVQKYHQIKNPRSKLKFERTGIFLAAFIREYDLMKSLILEINTRVTEEKTNKLGNNQTAILSLIDLIKLVKTDGIILVQSTLGSLLKQFMQLEKLTPEEYGLIAGLYCVYLDNLEQSELESNLDHMVKDLVLLFDHAQEKVVEALTIVVLQKDVPNNILAKLTFLQPNQILDPIQERIDEAIDKVRDTTSDITAQVVSHSERASASHENETKNLYLLLLNNFIRENYQDLMKSGYSSSWITQVYSNLMSESRDPHEKTRRIVAECMGQIGAIDPSWFERIPFSTSEPQITDFDVSSQIFATQLLGRLADYLVKTTQMNQKVPFFSVIFDLHSLLSQFQFARTQMNGKNRKQLDEAVNNGQQGNFPGMFVEIESVKDRPVFSPEINYEDWLRKWFKKMILVLGEHSLERKVFQSCAALFKLDYRLAEMLLPCIVYHILISTKVTEAEKRSLVDNEIQTILGSAIPKPDVCSFDKSSPLESRITVTAVSLNQTQHSCAQQIFNLYDVLSQRRVNKDGKVNSFIKDSLDKITCINLAHLAYGCQSYGRSLSYLEQYFYDRTKDDRKTGIEVSISEDEMRLLQKIYIALDEPDGVEGVNSIRKTTPSIMDQILAHEATNQLEGALTYCYTGIEDHPDDVNYRKMLLRCQLSLDRPAAAFESADFILKKKPEWSSKIKPYMIEATYKLSRWDDLEKVTKSCKVGEEGNTSQSIGNLLLCIRGKKDEKRIEKFKNLLDVARVKEMRQILSMASQPGAYLRGHQHIVRLHMLCDLDTASRSIFNMVTAEEKKQRSEVDLNKLWTTRNESILPSLRTLEPVLSLQRTIYCLAQSDQKNNEIYVPELTSSWLGSAKLARHSGNFERARSCLLKAQKFIEGGTVSKDLVLVSKFLIETTKRGCMLQDADSRANAVENLNREIAKHFEPFLFKSPSNSPSIKVSPSYHKFDDESFVRAYSKAKLLWIQMSDGMEVLEKNEVIELYLKLTNVDPQWEKPFFHLAKLYDRISSADSIQLLEKVKHQSLAVGFYCKSLEKGCKYSQESLPRLLDIWFDMDRTIAEEQPKKGPRPSLTKGTPKSSPAELSIQDYFHRACQCVENLSRQVQSYVIYTAVSQIMSRFNHASEAVTSILLKLMKSLVSDHPHQVMWRLVVYVGQGPNYDSALDYMTSDHRPLFIKMKSVAKAFVQLAELERDNGDQSIPPHFSIFKLFPANDGIPILVPSEKLLRVTLPASGLNQSRDEYDPFDSNHEYITNVCSKVTVLASLAKPKKLTIKTSHGRNFHCMVKPKDDLRVDSRTLGFFEVANRLLTRDPETRKRRLSIRTFAVIPLSSESGIVEWVDGLRDIRSILLDSYGKFRKTAIGNIQAKYPSKHETPAIALKKFQNDVMPRFTPPVFREWFLEAFPDVTSWQLARINYVRSLAVMSIVGYIIGLGDRHLENILFDQKSGEIVHVDFNCLFNRGELLEVPEVVPFRLTHNLVDAMGMTGYEGVFRRTCEETLRVMRDNRDMLMSVLNPFVFDPFVGANQQKKANKNKKTPADINLDVSVLNFE